MDNHFKARVCVLVAVVAGCAFAVIGTSVGLAEITDGEEIHACAHKKSGRVRVVVDPDECKPSEEAVSWNREGPPFDEGTSADNTPDTSAVTPPAGIADKYPNDVGIENDPAVIFASDFENGLTDFDHVFGAQLTSRPQNVHGGSTAMELSIPWPRSGGVSRGVRRRFATGYPTMYLRYYLKYEATIELFHGGTHNGGGIEARAPGVPDAYPGVPPDGTTHYSAHLQTYRPTSLVLSPGHVAAYVYHPEQWQDFGDTFFPSGKILPFSSQRSPYEMFGPTFVSRPDIIPRRGRWYCYELMLRANTPGLTNGRISIWIDGTLVGDFPNLRFRDVTALKSNRISLILYTQNTKVQTPLKVWVDDVVVAKSYIGPKVKM